MIRVDCVLVRAELNDLQTGPRRWTLVVDPLDGSRRFRVYSHVDAPAGTRLVLVDETEPEAD